VSLNVGLGLVGAGTGRNLAMADVAALASGRRRPGADGLAGLAAAGLSGMSAVSAASSA
jgi:hypothetical protein